MNIPRIGEWSELVGKHAGQRGALVGPGPSLDYYRDIHATLAQYDVLIGMNEALLVVPELHYLTIFDYKAARKTHHLWGPDLAVLVGNQHSQKMTVHSTTYMVPAGLTNTNGAGSIGDAIGCARDFGLAQLDLYGVDLCWVGEAVTDPDAGKYAQAAQSKVGHLNDAVSRHRVDHVRNLWTDQCFSKAVAIVRREIDDLTRGKMEIRNCSPISQLDCFPFHLDEDALDF